MHLLGAFPFASWFVSVYLWSDNGQPVAHELDVPQGGALAHPKNTATMAKFNLFDGDSYYAQFAQVTYKRLMSRNWVTYADIMAEHLGLESVGQLPCNVSNCDNYGELRKAFRDVRRTINEKAGQESFETDGNNRNKRFRYVGTDADPLSDMRNAKVISDLKQYWRFCQDSAGFFPSSWLDYFFKDSRDLLDIKAKRKKGEQVLSASLDRMLTNIEFLPFLYEAIINKQVLSVDYKPYDEEQRTLTFHPHYLKEFNGRWYLFGHVENQEPEFGYNIALDRICSKPRELYGTNYKPAPTGFYENFFKDIVGVSHMKDAKGDPYPAQPIHVRAHTHYVFKLMETKAIHPSQRTSVPFGQHADGEYGEFVVTVEPNHELIGRILQMGAGLEVVAPDDVRREVRKRVAQLAQLYGE